MALLAQVPLPVQGTDDVSVSGRVVDATSGRPIPGVVVTPAGSAVVVNAAAPLPPRALTNADGEFTLRGLQKGMLHFTAAKSGYADATYKQRRPGGSGRGIPVARGQRLAGVEIRMWRHAAITGTIVDEAGEPAVGVQVQAFARSFVAGRKRFVHAASGATDDRGIYRIARLTPGEYAVGLVSVQKTVPNEVMDVFFGAGGGGTPQQRDQASRELGAIGAGVVPNGSQYAIGVRDQTFTLPPGTLLPQLARQGGMLIYPTIFYPAASTLAQAVSVSLRSGEERGGIDLQMQPVRAVRVDGIVSAPDGPAATVGVRLLPAASSDSVEPIGVAATVTDGSGAFSFPAVPPGSYVLSVLRPPGEPRDPDDDARLSVTPGGDITIGSAVRPAPSSPPPPLPIPADATLYASMPLSVGDSDVTGVVVPLAAGPRVSGRVEFEGTTDKPSPEAVAKIRITLDPADGSRVLDDGLARETGHPDSTGEFRTFGMPPGKYVMRVNPPGGWFVKSALAGGTDLADVPFDLRTKDVTGVVITFTDRPASVSGVVRNAQGPDPDAVIILFPTDPSAWISRGAYPRRMRIGGSDAEGAFTIDGVLPGEYYLAATHDDEYADWQDPALLEALTRVARQVRIPEGERRTENLTSVVVR